MSSEADCGLSDEDSIVRPLIPYLREPLTKPPYLESLMSCKETSFELCTVYMRGVGKVRVKLNKKRQAFLESEAKLVLEKAAKEAKSEQVELEAKVEESEQEAKAEKPEDMGSA